MGVGYTIEYKSCIWWAVSLIFGTMTGFCSMVRTVLGTEAARWSVVSLLRTDILTGDRNPISYHSLDMVLGIVY